MVKVWRQVCSQAHGSVLCSQLQIRHMAASAVEKSHSNHS